VYLNGIGRLADDATVAAARQEMASIAATLEREFPNANTDITVAVQTLHERTVGNVKLALLVLLGAVAMVLLIACANVANLVLVRGSARQNEIAVRTALGAGRRGVLSYLLTENLLLATLGGVVGVFVAMWGIGILKAMAPQNLPRLDDVSFDAQTFLFSLAIVLLTTLLFGTGPSLQLSRAPLTRSLSQRGTIGARRSPWTRSLLLVAEVGLSLVLLLGAGLLLRSLTALKDTDLGFNPDGITVFMVSLPAARYPAAQVIATHEQLDEQFRAIPGVTHVARISGLPLGVSENVQSFTRPDQPPPAPGQAPSALFRVVDPEYFDTMNIPIMAGRVFTAADREGAQRVMVISKRLAETFWPGENPIGRPIQLDGSDPAIVVGVVGNVRSQAVARVADPEMYVPHAQTGGRGIMYVVKGTATPVQVLSAARDVVRRLDARLPLMFPGAMSDLVAEQLARPRFYLVLLTLFAVLAIVLAAVGVYGVVAYVVTERTREIGVRMALGAQRGEVMTLMLWQGLRPAAVGMAVGIVIALGAGQLIRGLLYEVRPYDPLTFVGVSALMLGVVVLACAIPARRASTVPPAEALRAE
jgi:putative ABC transport system permease protein